MKTVLKAKSDPLATRADLLLLTIGKDVTLSGAVAAADALLDGAVRRAIDDGEIQGKPGQTSVFHPPAGRGPRRVVVCGVGAGEHGDDWRAAGVAFGRLARSRKATGVCISLAEGVATDHAQALVDGVIRGNYRFDRFRTGEADRTPPIGQITVTGSGLGAADLSRTTIVAEHVAAVRDLANTPANHLGTEGLAAYAKGRAAATPGLTCRVLGPRELEKLGAGALLSVAQGSAQPAQLIVLRWKPAKVRTSEVLGIVGKAVTFDSGGISIKPAAGMEDMKMDMSGGAITIEGITAIARLGLPVEVIAVVPAAENMLGDSATRPGDVVTAMNGKTIEIANTDAEGRLILADGLTYAARNGATRLIEFSTLTGAMVVALGEVYAGLFGSHADWTDAVRDAAEASGDLAWPMPMHEGYRPLIKSDVADLSNAAKKRQAGAVYAAMFLREFTDGLPFCHLDVAGTASTGGASTGYGVPLITTLAEAMAAGR